MKKTTENDKLIRRSTRKKLVIGLNTVTALLLMGVLVFMVNYLSYRHYWRADWSRSRYYSLSDKTLSLLAALTNTIDVVVFFQPGQDVYDDVDNLLKEYQYKCPLLNIIRVDPDRDIARTEEMAAKYEVNQANVIVFDNHTRKKYLKTEDIVEYDYSGMAYGQQPTKVGFKGEQAFSSAIQSITQGRVPTVYFLQGHGERDIEDYSQRGGFSGIAQQIRRDNIDIRKLVLGEEAAIPADCDVLIIARPKKKLSQPELDIVRKYLDQKGRIMALMDPVGDTGLEALFADWGLRLGNDVVVDATRTLTGGELFATEYGTHPITKDLKGVTSIFYLPRSVEPIAESEVGSEQPDKPHGAVLVSCSLSGWAEVNLEESPMKYDPATDRPGPVGIAAAVEKGPVPEIDVKIRPTRLVVFGDSDFVSNNALLAGNVDFFMSALNWLLEREELMAISSKTVEQTRLVMNRFQLRVVLWVVVVAMPLAVALIGGLVWVRRRI